MNKIFYGATSDEGIGRTTNEDYFNFISLADDILFGMIADGMGGVSGFQPASIVINEISQSVKHLVTIDKEKFLSNADFYIRQAIFYANRVLLTYKLANEEKFAGFATTFTAVFCVKDVFYFYHCGNSRLYMIKKTPNSEVLFKQISIDHTKAKNLLNSGDISEEEYYFHPDRAVLTSALGVVADPEIQCFSGTLKQDTIFVLTTDGIHFAVNEDGIKSIVTESGECIGASKTLIQAAKSQDFNDNMTAMVIWVS